MVDRLEWFIGSDPQNPDTDNDGKKDGNQEVTDYSQPLLKQHHGMWKVTGTDPLVAPPTLPDRKFFGIDGEIIEGTATPNSVIAIYPYKDGGRSGEALAEAIADENGHYKLVIGRVFHRHPERYNKWNNTIQLVDEEAEQGPFVPVMTPRTPVIPPGSQLELTSWSDGFDGRVLFSEPELAKERGELVDMTKPFEDFEINPKVVVEDKNNLTDPEKQEVKEKIVGNEDLQNVIKGDTDEERGQNVVVNNDGSVTVTLKDDQIVTIPPEKVIVEREQPHGTLTLTPAQTAKDEPTKAAEGTDITIGGKVTQKTEAGDPLKNRDLTVVIKTGENAEQTIPATTKENGEIVNKDGTPIVTPAGNDGETTTVKVYDGNKAEGEPLVSDSIVAGKDPSKVGVPNFEEGDHQSSAKVSEGDKPADGQTPHTVTVTLVDKYGNPVKNAGDKIQVTTEADGVTVGKVTEGDNGTYTVEVTSTAPGTPEVKVQYGDAKTEVPGSPLHPSFTAVPTPAKPVVPEIKAPTEGDKELVITPPAENVNKIVAVIPGNGTVTLTKDADGTWKPDNDQVTVEEKDGQLIVKLPNPIDKGEVVVTVEDKTGNTSDEKRIPVQEKEVPPAPVKPNVPEVTSPTKGDTQIVIGTPEEDVTTIIAEIPGNGTVTIVKDGGVWTAPGNEKVTVGEEDGKIVVKLPNPIDAGNVVVTVIDKDGTPSDPATIPVLEKEEPVQPVKPNVPEVTPPTKGDTQIVIGTPDEDVTTIIAEIPGNGTITIGKDAEGNWTPNDGNVTVVEEDGKIIVKLPDPIDSGNLIVTVIDKDNTPSDPTVIPVKDKEEPVTPVDPVTPVNPQPVVPGKIVPPEAPIHGIVNQPIGDITIVVTDNDGNPASPGQHVWVKVPGSGTLIELTVGEHGRVTIPGFTPDKAGEYVIEIFNDKDGKHKIGELKITVSETANTVITVTQAPKTGDTAQISLLSATIIGAAAISMAMRRRKDDEA